MEPFSLHIALWWQDIRIPPILSSSPHAGLLPCRIPSMQDSSHMISPTEILPTRIPPDSSQTGVLPENSSRKGIPPITGFLPKLESSQNGIPPKTGFLSKQDSSQMGFLPKWDSSQNGIPPETGFLPERDSSQNGIPPKPGFLPKLEEVFFWEESRFGRNPVSGGIIKIKRKLILCLSCVFVMFE